MNFLRGTKTATSAAPSATGELLIGLRSHDLLVRESVSDTGSFALEGVVTAVEPLGPETLVHLDIERSSVIATARDKSIPAVGSRLHCQAERGTLYLFDAKTEKLLSRA